MRLIDADAFTEFLKDAIKQQKYEDTKIDGLLTVADVIEAIISELDGTSFAGFKNAPTIEPQRKKGKWKMALTKDLIGFNTVCFRCSVCNGMEYSTSPFCRVCGAKMEEGEQDEAD